MNIDILKGLGSKIGKGVNSRLGESVSDPIRAKIRRGEFKAVYSIEKYFHLVIEGEIGFIPFFITGRYLITIII